MSLPSSPLKVDRLVLKAMALLTLRFHSVPARSVHDKARPLPSSIPAPPFAGTVAGIQPSLPRSTLRNNAARQFEFCADRASPIFPTLRPTPAILPICVRSLAQHRPTRLLPRHPHASSHGLH